MTAKELSQIGFVDIFFSQHDDYKALNLLCRNQDSASKLYDLLKDGRYSFETARQQDGRYKITLHFTEPPCDMFHTTIETIHTLPQLSWLDNSQITRLICAFRGQDDRPLYVGSHLEIVSYYNPN